MKLSKLVSLNESEARVKFVQDRYRDKLTKWLATGDNARYLDRVLDAGVLNADQLVFTVYHSIKILQNDYEEGKIDVTEYLEWAVKQVLFDRRTVEDFPAVVGDMIFLKKNKQRFPADKRDINKMNRRQLQHEVEILEKNDAKSHRQVKRDEVAKYKKDIVVVHEGPDGSVYIPKTEESSCYLGRGTRWCTAARNNNMFSRYASQGDLYVMILPNGNKYQLQVPNIGGDLAMDIQFMDEKDEMVHAYSHEHDQEDLQHLISKYVATHLGKQQRLSLALYGDVAGMHLGDTKSAWNAMGSDHRYSFYVGALQVDFDAADGHYDEDSIEPDIAARIVELGRKEFPGVAEKFENGELDEED